MSKILTEENNNIITETGNYFITDDTTISYSVRVSDRVIAGACVKGVYAQSSNGVVASVRITGV